MSMADTVVCQLRAWHITNVRNVLAINERAILDHLVVWHGIYESRVLIFKREIQLDASMRGQWRSQAIDMKTKFRLLKNHCLAAYKAQLLDLDVGEGRVDGDCNTVDVVRGLVFQPHGSANRRAPAFRVEINLGCHICDSWLRQTFILLE